MKTKTALFFAVVLLLALIIIAPRVFAVSNVQFTNGNIGTNGYLGINVGATTTPTFPLIIAGSGDLSYFGNGGSTSTTYVTAGGGRVAFGYDGATVGGENNAFIQAGGSKGIEFWTNGLGGIGATGTLGMILLSNGNLGVGTTTPAYQLDVAGAASFENNQIHYVGTPTASSDVAIKSYVDTAVSGGGGPWTLNGTNVYTSNNNYNVGIGTSTPMDQLVVTTNNGPLVFGNNTGATMRTGGGSALVINGVANSNLYFNRDVANVGTYFQNGAAYLMTIASSGYVGIGTTGPAYLLNVSTANDNTALLGLSENSANNFAFTITMNAPTSTGVATKNVTFGANSSYSDMAFSPSVLNPNTLVLKANGNVGVGTTTPAYPLDVAGAGSFENNQIHLVGTPTAASDAATKNYVDSAIATVTSSIAGTTNYLPYYQSATTFGSSVLYQSSSYVGVGTVPVTQFDLGNGGQLQVGAGGSYVGFNAYYNGGWKYRTTDYAYFIRHDGADISINVAASGTAGATITPIQALAITSAGRVGIGMANPTLASLQVVNAANTVAIFGSGSTGVSLTQNYPGIEFNSYYSGGSYSLATGYAGSIGLNEADGSMDFDTMPSVLGSGTGQTMIERMRIASTGYVGINTALPAYLLDVAGAGSFENNPIHLVGTPVAAADAATKNYVDTAIANVTSTLSGTANYVPKFTGSNAIGNSAIYQSGSNIGIGTTTPSSSLTIVSPGNASTPYFTVMPQNQSQSMNIGYNHISESGSNGNNNLLIDAQGAGGLQLQANGGTGSITIGSTLILANAVSNDIFYGTPGVAPPGAGSAGEKIQLYGVSGTIGANDFAIGIQGGNIWFNSGGGYIWDYDSQTSSPQMVLLTNGNLGVGTTTPAYPLDIAGAGSFENNQIHYVGSPTGPADAATKSYVDTAIASVTSSISGTANYLPKFTGSNAIGNSAIYQSSSNIGIGTTGPSALLSVGASNQFTVASGGNTIIVPNSGVPLTLTRISGSPTISGVGGLIMDSDGIEYLNHYGTGNVQIADGGGNVSIGASTGPGTAKLYVNGNVGIGTTTPAYALTVNGVGSFAGNVIHNVGTPVAPSDAATMGYVQSAVSGGISGTTNYVPLFTGTNTIGNSALSQSGGNVTDSGALTVNSTVAVGSSAYVSSAGDVGVSRNSSPTTGAIYLGSGGTHYLYFDGTNYNFANGGLNTGAVSATSYTGAGTGLTGTAASLTAGAATTAGSLQYLGNTAQNTSGSLTAGATVIGDNSNGYPTAYGNVLNLAGGGYGQLLIGWSGTTGGVADNYIRSLRDLAVGTNNWSPWAKIITDQNYTSYALPLTGGTLSGTLTINGAGNTTVNLNVNGRIQTGDSNGQGGVWVNNSSTEFMGSNGANSIGFYNNGFWGLTLNSSGNVTDSGTMSATQYCINGANCISAWPSGVTSITAGAGLNGGTITNTGTMSVIYGSGSNTAVQGNTSITLSAGSGLTGSATWTLGAGGSQSGISLNLGSVNTWTGTQSFTSAPNSSWVGSVTASGQGGTVGYLAGQESGTFWAGAAGQSSATNGVGVYGLATNASGYGGYFTNSAAGTALYVSGTANITGKLTVGTVDPVYGINGKNYATYNAAMTGEKEESTGLFTLTCAKGSGIQGSTGTCSTTIDFNALPQGSDLWLFGKATNLPSDLNDLIVILTPSFNGNVWYNKDIAKGTLTVYGNQAGEVSYRFSAPRFDASQWPNTAPANEAPNFTIN